MLQGTVLPGPAPKAADIAASTSSRDSAASGMGAEASASAPASFGAVLKDKMGPEAKATATAATGNEESPALSASTASAPVDPALQALFAALQSAAVAPPLNVAPTADVVAEPSADDVIALDASTGRGTSRAVSTDSSHADAMLARAQESISDNGSGPARVDAAKDDPKGLQFADLSKALKSDKAELAAAGRGVQDLAPNEPIHARTSVESLTHTHSVHMQSQPAPELRTEASGAVMRVVVTPEVASPKWGNSFAERVTWITQSTQPTAELQLNPPQLGPVEVRVSIDADQQTSLSFFSPHAAVREAIQSAIPRLTEAFNASGLSLGNVFVGAESQSQTQSDHRDHRHGGSREQRSDNSDNRIAQVSWIRGGSLGTIDLFA